MPTAPRWATRAVTYRRQVVVALILVAVIPLAVFGFAALRSVEGVVGEEALAEARTAIRGVSAILHRDDNDLAETNNSYVTWDVLQQEVATLDTASIEAIRRDVIAFQIDQGEVDVAALIVGDQPPITGGSDAAAATLVRFGKAALSPSTTPPTGPTYADLGDGVYLVDVRPIDLSDRTGRGVDAAHGLVGLVLARRLDPIFVADVHDVTGFDAAIFDQGGTLRVASDSLSASAFPPDPSPDGDPAPPQVEAGLVGGWMNLPGLDGRPAGRLLATMKIEGIQTVPGRLLPLLGAGLVLAVLAAAILAILLGRRLRLRLDAIEGGLSAMAAGDLAVRVRSDPRDELGRLAAGLDRMAETLARRDRILRDAIVAIGDLTPDLGIDRVQADGVASAARIFELSDCRLESVDVGGHGEPGLSPADADRSGVPASGETHSGPPEAAGRVVGADIGPLGVVEANGLSELRLVGRLAAGRDWSEADQSLFDVYARLLRSAIEDATVHARTLDRVDRLGRLARLQGDFLRGVSHNLQAPLTNIVVVSEELVTAEQTDAHAREGALIIRAEADRLARLVEQLLTLSRLEAGTLRVEEEPIAPAPIIQRVWGSLGSPRRFRIDDRTDGLVAVADRAALEQVAWMLLDNAIKYAPSGAIGVTLEPDDRGNRIAIEVWDEGPGLPPEERARVFRRFVRGSTSAGRDGTGLGLDVARGLVRAMGGSIHYVAAASGGAGFRFTIPAEPSDRPA